MPPHKKSKLGAGCYERGERGAWRDYLVVDAAGCTHSFPVDIPEVLDVIRRKKLISCTVF